MPHGTFGDGARNVLALRCAPRSAWFERSPLRRLALAWAAPKAAAASSRRSS